MAWVPVVSAPLRPPATLLQPSRLPSRHSDELTAVFLNVFAFLRLVLASLHAVLVSFRVAVSSLQFVLAFLQVVAPSRHVAMVFRHVVATPLDVVLSSMQTDSAEPRVVAARLLKWERWRARVWNRSL